VAPSDPDTWRLEPEFWHAKNRGTDIWRREPEFWHAIIRGSDIWRHCGQLRLSSSGQKQRMVIRAWLVYNAHRSRGRLSLVSGSQASSLLSS